MPTSAHFKELKKRLHELRRHMLPKAFSSIGDYSERVLDRARGFRVLSHAEIESYLETVVSDLIKEKIQDFKTSNKASYLLICFLSSYHAGWRIEDDDESTFKAKRSKKSIIETVDYAAEQYLGSIVKGNQGIKVSDLKSLLLPMGVDFDKLDDIWLADMDNFGSLRGEAAHQSKKVQRQINPKDELNLVFNLLVGIKKLDSDLIDLGKM